MPFSRRSRGPALEKVALETGHRTPHFETDTMGEDSLAGVLFTRFGWR